MAQIFFATRNHWVTNEKDIIDIDIRAVKTAMDIYEIPSCMQRRVYERVKNVFHALLKEAKEDEPG